MSKLRIAITSRGAGLGARLDPHFGKCKQLLLIDESNRFDAWPSPTDGDSGGQALSLAIRLAQTGCDGLITGMINPQAYDVLRKSEIDVYLADKGSILELVELVRGGSVKPSTRQQVEPSFLARSVIDGTGKRQSNCPVVYALSLQETEIKPMV